MSVKQVIQQHRDFFKTGQTKEVTFRKQQLKRFLREWIASEAQIMEALKSDLGKPGFEAFVSEFNGVLEETRKAIKKISAWSKAKRVSTPLLIFPGKGKIVPEPYGTVLIISPWNYPLDLALSPMIGAIAAGNTGIIKSSEHAPASSKVMKDILARSFPEGYFSVVEGDASVAQDLLKEKFDYIFFTGSTQVGRIVMQAAANHLTPVTLELGGKSPVIVDDTANVKLAAKRIAWGKHFNAGQTCIAPDYVFVHESKKSQLIEQLSAYFEAFGQQDGGFAKIINSHHFARLEKLMEGQTVCWGGEKQAETLSLHPTLFETSLNDTPLMTEEIFGPLLPIVVYSRLEEVIDLINSRPKPLALYVFSSRKKNVKTLLKQTSSGGVCINDVLNHYVNKKLPFGGVGDSGIGRYHGKESFRTFSHYKSIQQSATWIDIPIKYPPYEGKMGMVKKLIEWMR
jgi:acyl-CoA reductase-like NAD-dependent aldehyde dehydrogenase